MTIGVPTCRDTETCCAVAARLAAEGLRGQVVVALDEDGLACGWATRAALQAARPRKLVSAVLDEDIPQLPPDIPAAAAAQLLRDRGLEYAFLMHTWPGELRPAAMVSRLVLEQHTPEPA
jgi:hypothetical protein